MHVINAVKNDTKYAACKQLGLTNDYRATVSYIDLFGFDQSSCSVANCTYFCFIWMAFLAHKIIKLATLKIKTSSDQEI